MGAGCVAAARARARALDGLGRPTPTRSLPSGRMPPSQGRSREGRRRRAGRDRRDVRRRRRGRRSRRRPVRPPRRPGARRRAPRRRRARARRRRRVRPVRGRRPGPVGAARRQGAPDGGRRGLAGALCAPRDDRRRPPERRRAPRARRPARGRGDRRPDRRVVPVGDGRARSRPASATRPAHCRRRCSGRRARRAVRRPGGARVDRVRRLHGRGLAQAPVNAVAGLMAVTRRPRRGLPRRRAVGRPRAALARECVAVARAEGAGLDGPTPRRSWTASPSLPAGPRHVDPLRPPRRPADGVGRAQRRRLPPGPRARDPDAGQRRARPAARGARRGAGSPRAQAPGTRRAAGPSRRRRSRRGPWTRGRAAGRRCRPMSRPRP